MSSAVCRLSPSRPWPGEGRTYLAWRTTPGDIQYNTTTVLTQHGVRLLRTYNTIQLPYLLSMVSDSCGHTIQYNYRTYSAWRTTPVDIQYNTTTVLTQHGVRLLRTYNTIQLPYLLSMVYDSCGHTIQYNYRTYSAWCQTPADIQYNTTTVLTQHGVRLLKTQDTILFRNDVRHLRT